MPARSVEPRTGEPREHGGGAGPSAAGERRLWRTVAVPSEHGGWGLTIEPVTRAVTVGVHQTLLGLVLVAVAAAGVLAAPS